MSEPLPHIGLIASHLKYRSLKAHGFGSEYGMRLVRNFTVVEELLRVPGCGCGQKLQQSVDMVVK
jgi:hypothetical protein